ncbi:hypothetical protein NA56DRAFT_649396 [Hyaloscypha hepaticicola]|uniref:Uncharacterized protein n=1 Tax=Hyaloscypha hepaticicola TaxID=2082293 RepID=A0A2J6PR75_9HELO|nr:hypothetical protein NA56DRAFT_649396 [Hyaloscypha hepaticicola]
MTKLATRRVSAAQSANPPGLAVAKPRPARIRRLDDIWDLAPELRDQPGPAERRGWSPDRMRGQLRQL